MFSLKNYKFSHVIFLITFFVVTTALIIISLVTHSNIIIAIITSVFIALLVSYISVLFLKKYLEQLNININNIVDGKENTEELSFGSCTNILSSIQKKVNTVKLSRKILSENVISSESDLKGNIVDASDAFCKISGYPKEELIGKPHSILRDDEMKSEVFEQLWNTIKDKKTWVGEVKNKTKNGGYYWVIATISPKYDENDNHIGYVSVRHDITNKKKFEELNHKLEVQVNLALEDSAKKEKIIFQSDKMVVIGEMIGNIAHQWRQPLTVISAFSTGILMQKEYNILSDEKLEKACNGINENAQYLSETIDTFRNFIKEEKELKEVVLQERIDKALAIVNTTLKSKLIVLINNIDYSSDIKVTIVLGEIEQVIINIINNAKDILIENNIKNPQIIINLQTIDNKAVITIEDNAGGIPEDIIDKIFDSYFTTKGDAEGTGLGLHMSKKIMCDSIKGDLYVKNNSLGAKFYLEIPLEVINK